MDFNQSFQLPADTSLRSCRRPFEEARFGALVYKPDDAAWGAAYYNPFAFDVAMLGNLFRFHFSVRHFSSCYASAIDQINPDCRRWYQPCQLWRRFSTE